MRPNSLPLLALASGTTAQNVVQFELNRAFPDLRVGILPEGLSRRGFYTETAANNLTGGGYYTQVTVGGQQVPMVLDTGSSDAWVVSYKADLCTSAKLQAYYGDSCAATYNPSKSSNYQLVTTKGFSITYLDGGGAIGDYISDDFSIGGVTVKSMQLGYATSTSRGTGILGVGFSANEATSKKYPNLIDSLANQGLISTKAYSLYLNDRRSPSGNILLGGVDTNKFVGPLAVLPIMKSSGTTANYTSFAVALNGMSAKFSSGTTTNVPTTKSNLPAILDSGTTLSYLPDDMATSLFNAVGAYTETRSTGLAFVDCKYLYSSSESFTLEFTFGTDTKISVPVEELVLDVVSGSSSALGLPFDNACLFGIQSTGGFNTKRSDEYRRQTSTSTFALLGDTFLRSAYVVYDLSNAQIGIAPANLNSSDANVTELKGAASELATLTGVASQQTTATVMPT
ncbi:acid protease, partial [Thozetella sp. PMI_491]